MGKEMSRRIVRLKCGEDEGRKLGDRSRMESSVKSEGNLLHELKAHINGDSQ